MEEKNTDIIIDETYEVTYDIISEQIDKCVKKELKEDFLFRKHQKEAIIGIIDKIVNNRNHNIIIEAPTGTGKSLINIISSQVLWEYYHIDSYILCSDLYLFDQYEKFVEEYPNMNIGCIKGQTGNYKCKTNKEDIRSADCQLAGISWSSLIRKDPHVLRKGYKCCKHCEYVKAREKALNSPVTITTYQNFLYQINIAYKESMTGESQSTTLGPRNVIFCDEAHNIPNIIQLKYTPEIKYSDLNSLLFISEFFNKMEKSEEWEEYKMSLNEEMSLLLEQVNHDFEDDSDKVKENYINIKNPIIIENRFNRYWNVLTTPKPSIKDLTKTMLDYHDLICQIKMMGELISCWVRRHKMSRFDKISEDDMKAWRICSWLANYCCVLTDFNNAWNNKNTGPQYILKRISGEEKHEEKTLFSEYNNDNRIVYLNCMKEDYLVYAGLLSWAKFRVFTSATIGGKDNFCNNNGIDYTEDEYATFDRVPTIFDYTKSPINFLNRYKMSFKEKKTSLPRICKMVQKLCDRYKDKKGIIQTGSYEITKALMNTLNSETKERLLTYNGSKEKIKVAEIHKRSQNTILIGPSLNQGIDLPDDNVRFIIILKVPYPSLGDDYVKEKIKLFPYWYDATTTTEIIQGIGRGVRNENDYCDTYILDACFYKLYLNTMDQFSDDLKERLKFYD